MGDTEMIFLVGVLTNDGVDNCLEDVFFRYDALHVLDEVVGLRCLIVLQIVDD